MATTLNTSELIRIIPQPRTLTGEIDIEDFLTEMKNYFDLIQISMDQRNILIRAFMDEDCRKKFEKNTDPENYEEKLRKLFTKSTNLAEDLQNALSYRKGSASIEEYIQQVEKNVEKIMKHKLTSTKLTAFLLKYCLDNEKMKEEITRFEYTESLLKLKAGKENIENEEQKGPTPTKYIKEILKTVEARSKQEEVFLINKPTYAAIANKNYQSSQQFNDRRRNENIRPRNISYPNKNGGNLNSETEPRVRNIPQCYACQEMGHIRRQCPNIQCSHCRGQGHLKRQCFQLRRDNEIGNSGDYRNNTFRRNSNQNQPNYYARRKPEHYDRIAAMGYEENQKPDYYDRETSGEDCRRQSGTEIRAENGGASNIGEMLGAIQTQ
jgi:Zinc knuckle